MEKCLKVAELATIWGVSVPTTWNRVRKEGLETVIKKDENGKDINYINISEDVINKYINNPVNNQNNVNNNGYYEDMLRDNNINNSQNDVIDADYTMVRNNDVKSLYDRYITDTNGYKDELISVYKELTEVKSRALLVDMSQQAKDKLEAENEMLKTDNKKLLNRNKWLTTFLITLIMVLIAVIITLFAVNNVSSNHTSNVSSSEQVNIKKRACSIMNHAHVLLCVWKNSLVCGIPQC